MVIDTSTNRGTAVQQGKLNLDGDRAKAYVEAATTREQLERASEAVLAGIVHKVLAPAGFQRMQTMGAGLADSAATDLTDADVVGLVELRLRGGAALQGRVPRYTPIAGQRATVDQFLGKAANPARRAWFAASTAHSWRRRGRRARRTALRLTSVRGGSAAVAAGDGRSRGLAMRWPKIDRSPPTGALPPLRRVSP